MAYTKTTWKDFPNEDTIIDADKLNNMEDGIEDAHTQLNTKIGTRLVGSATVSVATKPIIISDLDINADGGVYDIIFQGKTVTGSDGVTLVLNNVVTGYYYSRVIGGGTLTASGDLPTSKADYLHNNNVFQPGATGITEDTQIHLTLTLFNGKATMTSLGGISASGRQEVYYLVGTNSNTISNITSITFSTYTRNFAVGTVVRVYKR